MLHFFLLLLNHCVCNFKMLSRPSGFSLNIIFNPCLFRIIPSEVGFSSLPTRKLLLDPTLRNAPMDWTVLASKLHLPLFAG
jgi:hypothetical protein